MKPEVRARPLFTATALPLYGLAPLRPPDDEEKVEDHLPRAAEAPAAVMVELDVREAELIGRAHVTAAGQPFLIEASPRPGDVERR